MFDSDALGGLFTRLGFIDESITLSDLSQLFRETSDAIKEKKHNDKFHLPQKLRHQPIFPISKNDRQDGFDYLANCEELSVWFIADRDHLRASFLGKTPLLAFEAEELNAMDGLLSLFGVESRKLSKLVRSNTVPYGLVSVNGPYTSFLKERVAFIQA
jgi:hypothetical protein